MNASMKRQKPVRVFRHVACEGMGYLCAYLEREGIPYEVACIDQGIPVPSDLEEVAGLIFMGGPGSVNDPLPWVAEELALIRLAADRGVPMMGVCLGGQLIAKALEAQITRGRTMEVGWHVIEQVPEAAGHPWLQGLPDRFEAFHWHAWSFDVPTGATALLRSRCYEQQAFVLNNIFAMQFHLEITAEMIQDWTLRYSGDVAQPSDCVQEPHEMRSHLDERIRGLRRVADRLYGRWLQQLVSD